jgi:multidrug efflux system membrane fusion protein
VYLWYPRTAAGDSKGKSADKSINPANRAVPVIASLSRQGDMPVYLNGLGNVTAFNTVTLRTRVDGQIMKVAFTEGRLVKEGDLLIEIDPRPFQVMLAQAEAQKAKDEALLQNAVLDRERYKILFTQEAIPKQQYDTQLSTVAQMEATVKSDQAAIDSAKLNLVYCRIASPLTGRIGLRLVDQGNIVHATDTTGLVVIAQVQPIAVIFNIAEDSLPAVRKRMQNGQALRVDAYDRDLKMKLAQGRLLTIDNQIDQTTGTVRFKAQFENQDNSLFPNQFVNARLLLDVKHNTVLIPTAAIQHSPQSAFVYVVKPDNTAEVRQIVTTLSEGDEAAVDSGLQPGEIVVVDGVDKLQQGTKVAVRMTAPKGDRG